MRVVRIGDNNSLPVAPLFEVLERPSQWERQARIAESGWSEVSKFYHDFWKVLCSDLSRRPRIQTFTPHCRCPILGIRCPDFPILGAEGSWHIHPSTTWDKRESTAQRILSISAALKGDDVGDAVSGNRHHGTVRKLSVDSHNRDNWPQIVEWMHEQLHKYIDVLMAEEEIIGLEIIESIPTES